MTVTRNFIEHAVGDGCINAKDDVAHLQDLLIAAGEELLGGVDKHWGPATAEALRSFQKRKVTGGGMKDKELPRVRPHDPLLISLASAADILIPMPGKAGMAGVKHLHHWFRSRKVQYNSGAEHGKGNRATWGLHGDVRYAVQTTNGRFLAGPIRMDCTTYVNLMVSVYISGHCHAAPYAASCKDFGACNPSHCARDRYRMPLVKRTVGTGIAAKQVGVFETTAQIAQALAADNDGLYVIEVAGHKTWAVTHMVLYQNNTVYECTTHQQPSACISRSIQKFGEHKAGKIFYLFGPCPMKL